MELKTNLKIPEEPREPRFLIEHDRENRKCETCRSYTLCRVNVGGACEYFKRVRYLAYEAETDRGRVIFQTGLLRRVILTSKRSVSTDDCVSPTFQFSEIYRRNGDIVFTKAVLLMNLVNQISGSTCEEAS